MYRNMNACACLCVCVCVCVCVLFCAGARKHLERGHCQHMNNAVLRHKVIAERGADPDLLRQVQAYIQVRLHTHTHTRTHIHTQADRRHTRARGSHTHTHTHKHAHTQTHTRIADTHTHTHTTRAASKASVRACIGSPCVAGQAERQCARCARLSDPWWSRHSLVTGVLQPA